MDLKEIIEKINEFYGEIDKKSGPIFLLSVLMEEVGELSKAIRKKENIGEEISDVLFILLSISNYFEIDVEKILMEKYLMDPKKIISKWNDLP